MQLNHSFLQSEWQRVASTRRWCRPSIGRDKGFQVGPGIIGGNRSAPMSLKERVNGIVVSLAKTETTYRAIKVARRIRLGERRPIP